MVMRLLYTLGIYLYAFGVRVCSLWNNKARQMCRGWRDVWHRLDDGASRQHKTAWFHASSLGEFEQARPVLEQFKIEHPDYYILVSFFSPSGYEVRKHYAQADCVCYLPMDTMRNAHRWVQRVRPTVVFFVKYDFWFNYMHCLQRAAVPTYLFSAIFRPNQYFFRWYGRWYVHQLECFTHLFVQNNESLQLLRGHGITRCSIAGDTRFDQVCRIAASAKQYTEIEQFINGRRVLMAGSSWEPDEQQLKYFIDHTNLDICLIVAPHVISDTHLTAITTLFGVDRCVRYSVLKEQPAAYGDKLILIIDNMGMLSSLYGYARVAYIGGGFGQGIHNILEALTYGKPVCFGPNYHKFQEARDILRCGGGFTYTRPEELTRQLTTWFTNEEQYRQASEASARYVREHVGASRKILDRVSSRLLSLLVVVVTMQSLSSCCVSKYLHNDEYILAANHYDIITDSTNIAGVENVFNPSQYSIQNPNKYLLGLVRVKMRLYCMSNPADSGWVNRYLRRKGEAPVIYNDNSTQLTANQFEGLLYTKGCFQSEVSYDTLHRKRHDVAVTYHIKPSPRYRIAHVDYRAETPNVERYLLQQWSKRSLLRVGDYYDQDVITNERNQLVEQLRNDGFYYASKELIQFTVDTTVGEHQLNITLYVNNPIVYNAEDLMMERPLQQYIIDRIHVYPSVANATDRYDAIRLDTLQLHYTQGGHSADYVFHYDSTMDLRPSTIARALSLYSQELYRTTTVTRSYNSLLNLNQYRYINIDFVPSPRDVVNADSIGRMDAVIVLRRGTKRKLSLSLEVNNSSPLTADTSGSLLSSGNFGIETILSYQNKNLLGGAELLQLDGSFLIELPKLFANRENAGRKWSVFESGLDASLDIPRVLLPNVFGLGQRIKPHTIIKAGVNYQDRYYFERLLLNTSWGYSVSANRMEQHQLLPIELTFARFFDIDSTFWQRIERSSASSRLKYQYSDHFIMDARYDYVFTNQQFNQRRNFTYLHFSVESAGNVLALLSNTLSWNSDTSGIHTIYGVPYSQYIRFNSEVKHYFYFGLKSTFVTRMLLGVGIPYGNSSNMQMPYEKSFFGGGPSTMRAWHLRRLGPGIYAPEDNLIERTGDMTIVVNTEARFPIFGIFEGALFADIGNVWLVHESASMPGGTFSLKTFLPSLAVGSGFGIRANFFSIITLRLDVGIPLYDPSYDEGQRWRIRHWKDYTVDIRQFYFGPLTLNIGIDYPF